MGAGATSKNKNDRYLQLERETQERSDLPVLPWRQKTAVDQALPETNGHDLNSSSGQQHANVKDRHVSWGPTETNLESPKPRSLCEDTVENIDGAKTEGSGESKIGKYSLANHATVGGGTVRARQWIVKASWNSETNEQLTIKEGDAIEVLELQGTWALCRTNGEEGLVPRKNIKQTSQRIPGSTMELRAPKTRNRKMFSEGASVEIAKEKANDSEMFAIKDCNAENRVIAEEKANDSEMFAIKDCNAENHVHGTAPRLTQNESDDCGSPPTELSHDWRSKLASTMTLHTVSNAIRLAHYLTELLSNGYGTASALHIAAWEGSVDAVEALTSGSASMAKNHHSRNGELTPLHIATLCGHGGVVDCLLQRGVNVDVSTVHGLRALHIAAFSGPELAEVLLGGNANVDSLTADEDTPLHIACSYNQIGTAEVLLKAGANVGLANAFGVVPLHITAAHSAILRVPLRDAHGVLLLSRRSADPAARDKHDRTAHSLVQKADGDASLLGFLAETAAKTQTIAAEYLGDGEELVSDNEPTPENSEDEAESGTLPTFGSVVQSRAKGKAESGVPPAFGSVVESSGKDRLHQSGNNDMLLASENAALSADIKKLRQELESSRSNERLLQELLDNTRITAKSLQSAVSERGANQELDDEAGKQARLEMEQEISDLLQRQAGLEEERRLWHEEKELLQQEMKSAQDARDSAQSDVKRLQEERDSLAVAATDAETAAVASSRLEAELGEKASEIGQKVAELNAARTELEQKSKELDLASKTNTRLSDELARKGKQYEEAWKSLSDLRAKHSELREEHSKIEIMKSQNEASFQEKTLSLEGDLRDKCLQIEKLEADNAEQAARLQEMDAMKERVDYANRMLKPLEDRIQELHDAFAAEQSLRKRYHNQLQDAKGAIRVYARIRPVVPRESGQPIAVRKLDAFSMGLDGNAKARQDKTYTYDSIFDDHSTQEDVFSECRSLVSSAIDGFNVTVFAYGQTGAGKTHTMYGNPNQPGLVPRIVEETFSLLGKYSHDCNSRVLISMFELYCNDLVDLLLPRAKAQAKKVVPPTLDIKKDSRGSVFVENATQRQMTSSEELLQAMSEGMDRRHVAATAMNADSSRSHLIFIMLVESTNKKTKQVTTGKLTLCDLAGSERLKKSEVTGEQKKEAQAINMSLTALGDVIEALSKQAKHIPYRNHKLTQLLSDSIGGNAKTLMFVNCSPVAENGDETHSSLNYAARAKLIVNKVEKNQDSQEVARLKKVVQLMNQELEQYRGPENSTAPGSFDNQWS